MTRRTWITLRLLTVAMVGAMLAVMWVITPVEGQSTQVAPAVREVNSDGIYTEVAAASASLDSLTSQTATDYRPMRLVDNAGTGYATLATLSPCATAAWTRVMVDIVTATTTKVIESTGSTTIYICRLQLFTDAANDVTLIGDADADECDGAGGTAATGMAGGPTTGEGWNFPASGGVNDVGTGFHHYSTSTTGQDVCIISSANTQLNGVLYYVAQ